MKTTTLIIISHVTMLLIGLFIGLMWGWYSSYHPKPSNNLKGRTGYTVINYDSVEWSDGKREKYNWHVHTRKYKAR